MKKLIYSILLCCLWLSASISISIEVRAFQAEPTKLKNALASVKAQLQQTYWHTLLDDNNWAYTVETQLDNGNTGRKIQQTKQRFDPSRPPLQQWQLLESDFAQPTPARLAQYKKTQQEIAEEAVQKIATNVEIVDFSTLTFIDQNDRQQRFAFIPRLPMFDDDINQLFKGVLIFDKQIQRIKTLTIEAQESFSPRLSFKLDSYLLNIDFDQRDGELHVVSINSEKSGSAFFFTRFNEKSSRVFSNLKRMD